MHVKIKLNKNNEKTKRLRVDINIITEDGNRLACFTGIKKTGSDVPTLNLKIKKMLLSSGSYSANVSLVSDDGVVEYIAQDAFYFEVKHSNNLVSGSSNAYYKEMEVW